MSQAVTEPARTAPTARREWPLVVARAVVAAVAAAVITFTTGHSIRLGLAVFGAFAAATGIALLLMALGQQRQRVLAVAQAAVSLAAGVLALGVLGLSHPTSGLFTIVVGVWALVAGACELWRGWSIRPRGAAERDRVGAGVVTLLLAVAVVVVPSDLHTVFSAPDGTQGAVTTSVTLVGVLGAYAAIMAVYWAIGAVSLRHEGRDERSAPEGSNGE